MSNIYVCMYMYRCTVCMILCTMYVLTYLLTLPPSPLPAPPEIQTRQGNPPLPKCRRLSLQMLQTLVKSTVVEIEHCFKLVPCLSVSRCLGLIYRMVKMVMTSRFLRPLFLIGARLGLDKVMAQPWEKGSDGLNMLLV